MIARLRLRDIFRGKRPDDGRPRDDGQLRRIVLAGERVDYRLIRARRRTIGMQIGLHSPGTALGVDPRDRSGARRATRGSSVRSSESKAARRAFSRLENRRLDSVDELTLTVHPLAEIAADLLNLSVLHPSCC
jgi:hypothetical protein